MASCCSHHVKGCKVAASLYGFEKAACGIANKIKCMTQAFAFNEVRLWITTSRVFDTRTAD